MLGGMIPYKIIQVLFLFYCHLCCLDSKLMLFYWLQFLLVSGFVIQIIPPKVSQNSTTMLQLKVNARSPDHQFFKNFFQEVRCHKVRKVTEPDFWKKNQMGSDSTKNPKMASKWGFYCYGNNLIHSDMLFLLQYESGIGLLTFCKTNMFGENLVLELCSKNLKTNHNVGFFKLQYLKNSLRYIWCWFFGCDLISIKAINIKSVEVRHAWTCPK